MKIHFMFPTAFERLSGVDDIKSQYVVLRHLRACNELICALRDAISIIFKLAQSLLNAVQIRSGSSARLFSFGVKTADSANVLGAGK